MIASRPLPAPSAALAAPAPVVNRLALVGASGFIGLRVTEVLADRPDFSLTAIVRLASSLAVLARRPLPWKISSFTDEVALAAALRDTDTCVHAAIGDPAQIVRMATAAYRACAAAGVSRLVWLSSATVHGQNCAHGSDENSALHDRHPLVYPNAKVRAEWALRRLARDGRLTVIMLRPGIVFGPRSRWIADAAAAIQADKAVWHNGGLGVCNTVYIDNLVEAIRLAATVPGLRTGPFYIGDAERVTWRDFLLPIAWHLGRDESAFTDPPAVNFPPERESILMRFAAHPAYHSATQLISDRTKRVVKAVLRAWRPPSPGPDPWQPHRSHSGAALTHELALLQQCAWHLPLDHARRTLGYAPPVTFAEGMNRSLAWLDFAEGRS